MSQIVQEIKDNEIKTDGKIRNNRASILFLDKKKNMITLIDVDITSQDILQIFENKKFSKYDLLANELGLIYKCSVEIILYVITWDYCDKITYVTPKKIINTVEAIFFDSIKGIKSRPNAKESCKNASMGITKKAEIPGKILPYMICDSNEEYGLDLEEDNEALHISNLKGGVRNKVVKRAARLLLEKHYSSLTYDFYINKRVVQEKTNIQSKRLRNKVAGYSTHLMSRMRKGVVKGIFIAKHEEERIQKENFIPKEKILDSEKVEVDDLTLNMINQYGFKGNFTPFVLINKSDFYFKKTVILYYGSINYHPLSTILLINTPLFSIIVIIPPLTTIISITPL
ncbi:ribosomal protein S17 [Hamiltosporidium tvaerminnensis]|uniref:Ribosomal protein S17 n=1 Tax=Hamiltosporidium tvaerminnensis TaxID=1176355 RepID=A0A4Q9LX03_9MICR|nr:ribosomal protein S17 [Hamiltosporidium tvaerminnensis]